MGALRPEGAEGQEEKPLIHRLYLQTHGGKQLGTSKGIGGSR
jgi:hypothetical protein